MRNNGERKQKNGRTLSFLTLAVAAIAIPALSCDTRASILALGSFSYGSLTLTSTTDQYESVTEPNSGVELKYRIRSTVESPNGYLEFEAISDSAGWVAVGFGPDMAMLGANIIIGFVAGSAVYVRDDYGHQLFNHQSDTAGGGSTDLFNVTGNESGGRTTIHVVIPLNSLDSKDKKLIRGSGMSVILAKSSIDDFSTSHDRGSRGSVDITIP
jgi:hypothetical protein